MNRPRKARGIRWREDGEENQIVIVHKDEFPLPKILNPTAGAIFLACDGNKTAEDIAASIRERFDIDDTGEVAREVKECLGQFMEKGLIEL